MSKIKYKYDQENGIFVKENELSVNWLVSNILNRQNLQITKISNDEVIELLNILDNSDLRMPNGQHSLFWLKAKLKEYCDMTSAKQGEVWVGVADRYRWIIEQIDMVLISTKNIQEKMKNYDVNDQIKVYNINRTPNNMELTFERKDEISNII